MLRVPQNVASPQNKNLFSSGGYRGVGSGIWPPAPVATGLAPNPQPRKSGSPPPQTPKNHRAPREWLNLARCRPLSGKRQGLGCGWGHRRCHRGCKGRRAKWGCHTCPPPAPELIRNQSRDLFMKLEINKKGGVWRGLVGFWGVEVQGAAGVCKGLLVRSLHGEGAVCT